MRDVWKSFSNIIWSYIRQNPDNIIILNEYGSDPRNYKNYYFTSNEIRPEKNIGPHGIWTMTSAMPVQHSINLANKPTWKRSFC